MNITENKINQVSDEMLASQAISLVKSENSLSSEIQQKLAESRQQAVSRLALLQSTGTVTTSGFFSWFDTSFIKRQMHFSALTTAFVVMLVTFFAVQHFGFNDDLENSDAFLLAAELPPEAFADKGFDTWLVTARN
jgi:hypothetical protein